MSRKLMSIILAYLCSFTVLYLLQSCILEEEETVVVEEATEDPTPVPTVVALCDNSVVEEHTGGSTISIMKKVGQSFELSADGDLASIKMNLKNDITKPATSLTLELREGGTNPENGTLIATSTITDIPDSYTWTAFEFDSNPSLSAFTTYWWSLAAVGDDAPSMRLYSDSGATYLNGEGCFYNGGWFCWDSSDYQFKVSTCD